MNDTIKVSKTFDLKGLSCPMPVVKISKGIKEVDVGEVIEAQTELIGEIQDGQRALVEAAGWPVVIDAEVRASLAEVPPACISKLGGDPMSAQCALMACWAFGQSAAQRPDCDAVEALVVEALNQKGRSESSIP